MDAKARIRALRDVAFMDPPLGGSFRQLESVTGVTAAGYNDRRTVEDDDAVPRRQVERLSEQ